MKNAFEIKLITSKMAEIEKVIENRKKSKKASQANISRPSVTLAFVRTV